MGRRQRQLAGVVVHRSPGTTANIHHRILVYRKLVVEHLDRILPISLDLPLETVVDTSHADESIRLDLLIEVRLERGEVVGVVVVSLLLLLLGQTHTL